MKPRTTLPISLLAAICVFTSAHSPLSNKPAGVVVPAVAVKHYLYVAVPGIRDYLGYGGHGILVFDIDNNHRFVKRITTKGFHPDNTPSNVKGVAVSIPLNSIFISTIESLQRIDLATDKLVWEKPFEGGCDRMSISPDGKTMWLPSFEKGFWNVVDCATGDLIKKIDVYKRAHNTICGPSGKNIYLDDINLRRSSVNPNLKAKGVLITPNPSNGKITVQFYPQPVGLQAIQIYSIDGRKVAETLIKDEQVNNVYYYNLDRYSSGIYVVRVVFNDKVITRQIIKATP